MEFELSVPGDNQDLHLRLNAGETLFTLGANGTGKSGLMQPLYTIKSSGHFMFGA